jgi:hypothetical protein
VFCRKPAKKPSEVFESETSLNLDSNPLHFVGGVGRRLSNAILWRKARVWGFLVMPNISSRRRSSMAVSSWMRPSFIWTMRSAWTAMSIYGV